MYNPNLTIVNPTKQKKMKKITDKRSVCFGTRTLVSWIKHDYNVVLAPRDLLLHNRSFLTGACWKRRKVSWCLPFIVTNQT